MAEKTGGRRVMVVDDTGSFGFTLSLQFRQAGWDVFCCGNGRAALARLEDEDFDLVLSDVHMPTMGGIELAEAIRAQYPGVRVILMSSSMKGELPDLPEGVPFLAKPVNVELVVKAFERGPRIKP